MKTPEYPLTYAKQMLHEKCLKHKPLGQKKTNYKHECLACLLDAFVRCWTSGKERGINTSKQIRYQVFEKRPSGYEKIHNFTSKKAAEEKHRKLEARNWAAGPIWDYQNNNLL